MSETNLSKWLNRWLFFTNIVVLAAAAYFIFTRGWVSGAPGWTAVEFTTAVLAAVSLLITVLGIFIAVLAIWGYDRIKREASYRADAAANAYLKANVPDLVANLVPRQVAEELERRDGDPYGAAAGKDAKE